MSWLVPGARESGDEKRFKNLTQNSLSRLQAQRQQVGGLAGQAGAQASSFRSRAGGGLSDYLQLLNRRRTDADRTQFIGGQTQGVNDAYRTGQSNLASNLRARGLSPDSGAGAGGAAILEGMRSQSFANAGNQATQQFDVERQGNLQQIMELLYGREQDYTNLQNGYMGQEYAMGQDEFAQYNSLFNQERSRRDQENARRSQGITSLIGTLGQFGGMGGFLGSQGGGEGFTVGGGEQNRMYAQRNNAAVAQGAPSARDAWLRKQYGL
jgi:hypothetical protein